VPWSHAGVGLLSELSAASRRTLATRVGLRSGKKVNYHLRSLEAEGCGCGWPGNAAWGGLIGNGCSWRRPLLLRRLAERTLGHVAVESRIGKSIGWRELSHRPGRAGRPRGGRLVVRGREAGKRLATLSWDTDVRFRSATYRAVQQRTHEAITETSFEYHDESAPAAARIDCGRGAPFTAKKKKIRSSGSNSCA